MRFPSIPAPIRITLIYVVIASVWILFSDWFLFTFVSDPLRHQIEGVKGVLFVLFTGSVMFGMMEANEQWHRRTQAKLRERDQALEQAQATAQVGSWTADLKAGTYDASAEGARLVGWTPGRHRFDELINVVHPDDRERMQAAWEAAMLGAPYDIEHRILLNGQVRWLHIKAKVEFDNTGRAERATGVTQDITDRKLAAQALEESEARYRSLFQNNRSVMLLIDPDTGDIVDANPAACEYYGYLQTELTRLKVSDINTNAQEKIRADMASAANGRNHFFSFQHRLANGEPRDVEVYSGPIIIQGQSLLYSIVHDITERKQTEQALHDSEERYRSMFEDNRSIMLILDPETGLIADANPAACVFYGYSRHEITQLKISSINVLPPEETLARLNESVHQLRNHYLFQHRLADGQLREVEVYSGPIQFGGKRQVYAIIHDVTQRQRAEQALIESEDRFRSLFENMIEGVALHEMVYEAGDQAVNYRILSVNPSFEKQTGLTAAATQGKLATEAYGVEVAPYLDIYARVALTGQPSAFETYFSPLDKHFHVSVNSPERGQFVTVFEDITERKRAQDVLRRSEERFSKAFQVNPAAMTITRLSDGVVTDVNESYQQVFGFSRTEIVGHTATDLNILLEPGAPEQLPERLQNSLSAKNVEARLRTKSGKIITVLLSNEPVEVNGVACMLSSMVDITERKRADEALEQAAEELARSNAELEQFAYVASHDLQEPLRAVTGMLQLLQQRYQGQLDERADEFIGHAVDGATRMQALIKDLLALSRVGTKGKPFEPVVTTDLLQIVIANLGVALRESGAVVTYDELPALTADATQMMQLFQNLVGNALKFHGQEPPRIHVSAKRIKGTGAEPDAWQFAVHDNGIGIEPQYFERIFIVFQRLHTRREYPGTGIGLALCKKIVARHGGRIWLDSQPGQGSTFFFTIPDQPDRKLVSYAR